MAHRIFCVIPGLSQPRQLLHDLSYDLPLPGLYGLLSAGTLENGIPADVQSDPLLSASLQPAQLSAAAALRRIGLGRTPDNAHWLCIDPVHMGFRERSIVVQDPALLQLGADEARAIAVSLAPTLAIFGELSVDDPLYWHLRLLEPAPPFESLETAIKSQASVGLSSNKRWQVALNEAQMMLHQHPINAQRSACGLPVVNSIWPWGGGQLAQASGNGSQRPVILFSNNPCLRGLARYQQQRTQPVPNRFADLTVSGADASMIVIDTLNTPAGSGDAQGWREALLNLDQDWLAPLLADWQAHRHRDTSFHLIFPGATKVRCLSLAPVGLSHSVRRSLAAIRRRLSTASAKPTLDDLAS